MIPALEQKMSTAPYFSSAATTRLFMSPSWPTSQRIPMPPTSAATALASVSLRSAHTTPRAPSLAKRLASALPMPLAAPVTTATLSFIFMQRLFHTIPGYGGTGAGAARAGVLRVGRLRQALRTRLAAVALAGGIFRGAGRRLRPGGARIDAPPSGNSDRDRGGHRPAACRQGGR